MGRGMDIAVCTVSQCFFGVSFLQSCVEYPFRVCHFPYLHISLSMKRRRLVEPCGADAAGDKRGASSTSPTMPEAPWEAVPHEGHVIINVLACGTDARVVHRVMQICEAAIEDWDNSQENNGQMRGASYIDVPSRCRGGHSHWLV